jgi:hypothetical protein
MRSRRRSYSFRRAARTPRAIVGWRTPPCLFERFNFLIGSFISLFLVIISLFDRVGNLSLWLPVINNLHTAARPFGAARPAFSRYIPIELGKLERDRDRSND